MKKHVYGLCFLALAVLMVLASCSKSTDSNLNTEAMAESLKGQTDILVNNLGAFLDDGLDYINFGVGYLAKPADTTYYLYDVPSGWWTFVQQLSMTDPWVWTINELDSIRFSAGGIPQMQPNEMTDALELRIVGDEFLQFAVDSSMALDVDFDCEFGSANTDTVDIDGLLYFGVATAMGNFEFDYYYDCYYSSIRLVNDPYSYDNYPIAGSMTLALDFSSTGDPANEIPAGDWSVDMILSFSNAGYHGEMTIEGDHFTWDATWDDISQAPVYGEH